MPRTTPRRRRPLLRCRRSSIAIMVAFLAPVLGAAIGLGVEVSNWSVEQARMQRAADAAALSGVINYKNSASAQSAATAAAELAEVNGVSGAATRSWNSTSQTLSDNDVTAQIVNGIQNSSDTAVKVTVQKSVPLEIAKIFSSLGSVTVSATSYAELVSSTTTSMQPCMLALGSGVDGITTNSIDVTFSGTVNINADSCSIRSDDGITLSGTVNLNVGAIYAGGAVTTSGSVSISGPVYQNAGQIPDPYTSFTALQNALTSAKTATGTTVNVNGSKSLTLNPGNYNGISVTSSSNVVLNPGLYVVNGNISFAGSSNITGSGVTIVSTGTLNTSGSSNVNLTAATTSTAVSGAIPGVLFASTSTNTSSFNGSSSMPFTGALYYPNGEMQFAGTATDGSEGCAEIIAKTIVMTGTVELATSCSTYGLPTFSSLPATEIAKLVQ